MSMHALPEVVPAYPVAPGGQSAVAALAVRSFFYAVFKHRRLVIGVFLVVFIGSLAAALLRPRLWLASSKVLVKLGETVQLAPSEAPSRSINQPLSQEVVKAEADIVKSYDVIKGAVDRLGIKPEEGVDMAELLDGLQQALTVTPNPGVNTLQISFLGRNPERAARMVNAITDVYIDHHNKVYSRGQLDTFYGEQLKLLQTQMIEAQEKLRTFLRDSNIIDVEQEIRMLNQDALEQDKGLRAHRAKILATQRKIVELDQQLANTPQQIPFAEEYLSNPTLLTFKTKLTELEVERFHLLEMYMTDDRRVKDVEEQIGNLQARIKTERDRILNKQTMRRNDLYEELQRNRLSLQTLLADATAREPLMAARLEDAKKRLEELRDKKFLIANLQQEAEQKQYAFDSYFKKQEEARVSQAMTDQSMVNVSIIDSAVPPLQPANGLVLPLLLGVIGGIGLAASTAVAVEYVSRRLRFEEEVERYLELPVLAVIPDLEATPDLAHP